MPLSLISKVLIATLLALLFGIFTCSATFASDNLFTNGDMEDWEQDLPVSWSKSGSKVLTATIASDASQVKSGTRSALLKLTSANEYYLSQVLPVSGNTMYRYSGFAKSFVGNFLCVLRLAWYSGENKWLSTKTSNEITGSMKDFTELSIESTSPTLAKSVQAKVSIIPESGSTDSQVLVDALSFSTMDVAYDDSSTIQSAPTPLFEWSTGENLIIGQSFKINLKLENFGKDGEYYLKLRGGPDESHLSKIQTKNNGSYFTDNESWENFPIIKTDSSGNWSGDIWGLLSEDKDEGNYKIKIRARKKETDTFSESEFKDLKFSKPVEIIVIATPAAATKAAIIPMNIGKKSSESAVLGSSVSAAYNPVVNNKEIRKDNSIGIALAVSGASLVLLAALIFVRKRLTV